MNTKDLIDLLETNGSSTLNIALPTGKFVPSHFHITEVGRVDKKFIDCGGIVRQQSSCALQVWTANDFNHRLVAEKLAKIMRIAGTSFDIGDLPITIEYGTDVASQYVVSNVDVTKNGIIFFLNGKQTECLAPDKCGVSGCC